MSLVKSSTAVLDSAGDPAVGRVVRVYRRDTGALIATGTTSDGSAEEVVSEWATDGTGSAGWAGYTLRMVLPASGADTVSVYVEFSAAAGASAGVTEAYVGVRAASGDSYDFAATPVQLAFSGSPSVSIAAGTSVESDEAVLTAPAGSKLVVSAYFSGTSSVASRAGMPAGWLSYFSVGNSAADIDVSGYTPATAPFAVTKIVRVREALTAGNYLIDCGGYTDAVNVVLLDDDAAPSLHDLILRTTPV